MVPSLSQSSSASNPGRVSGSDSSGSSESTDVSSSKNLRKKSTVKQRLEHSQSTHRPTKAPNKPLGSRVSKTDNDEYYEEEDSYTSGSSDRKSDSEFIPEDTPYEDDNGIYPCQKNSYKGRRSLEVSNNRPKNRANEVDGSGSPVSKEGTEEVVGDPSGTISEIRKVFNNGQLVERLVNYPELEEALTHFKENFIPYLQNNENKVWQAEAEIKNLEHIGNCADYMLNNMEFKPEFVAKIAATRLGMAMFGAGNFQNQNDGTPSKDYGKIMTVEDGYQPSCMWDFGEDRTVIPLEGQNYESGRELSSPTTKKNTEKRIPKHKGNKFSLIRGRLDSKNKNYEDYYIMPNGQKTPCLPNRFRQYLAHAVGDKNILSIKKDSAVADLPPAMLFLVGLQFGQKNIGSWNEFSIAAKKYLSLKVPEQEQIPEQEQEQGQSSGRFFWPKGVNGPNPRNNDVLSEVFGPLRDTLGLNENLALRDFEEALLAYYAMNMEILSRTKFSGNNRGENRGECCIDKIFRLEGLKSLEGLSIVQKNGNNGEWKTPNAHISEGAKRAVFVASSANMFVTSLDKPKDFPPPIKIITKYENVHHARIFGSHFFNVDLGNASRKLPDSLRQKGQNLKGTYEEDCPFFKDRQREFLMMPHGLSAEIVGILPWAAKPDDWYVWVKEDFKAGFSDDTEIEKTENIPLNINITPSIFCLEKSMQRAEKNRTYSDFMADLLQQEQVSISPRIILQIMFDKLEETGASELLSFFGKNGDNKSFNKIKKYAKQLRVIKETHEFSMLYGCKK